MADRALNPLDLSPDEFSVFVDRMSAPTTPAGPTTDSPAAVGMAPEAVEALAEGSRQIGQLRTDLVSEGGRRMGIRDGVFLDISKGTPSSVRFRLGLDENKLNQFKLLTGLYGVGNVDLSDEGRFILRNQPTPDGKTEDVMVDPVGFEGGDVSQMASQTIPMIGGVVGAFLGRGAASKVGAKSFGKLAGAVTGMALGQESTGAAQDAVVRAIEQNEINATEIAKRRAAMAVLDEVLGFATAGVGKAMTKFAEGVIGIAQIPVGTTPTREAAKKLAEQTGVKFPLTPGQESERQVLLRLEAMTGERLGSAAALDRVFRAQQAAESELRRVFLGLPRTMTDDELAAALPQSDIVGKEGLTRLGSEALRMEGGVAKAAQTVERTGTVEAQLKSGVTLGSPLNATQVGRAARSRAVGDFDSFHSGMSQRYEQFLANPEVQARTIAGDSLSRAVRQIEVDLTPQALKQKPITTAAGPLVGPQGQQLTAPKLETLEAFVPGKVRGFIDELKGLRGASVSVNDLKQTRTAIDNAIKEGIAIPGTDVAQLVRLKSAVSDQIESALQGMPNKSLLQEWKQLSADYATGMQRFNRVGVREMLVKEGEQGAIGDTQIAEQIVGNSPRALDNYNNLKAFFGASSPEFAGIQANARQRIILGSINELTGYVDGQTLRARLRDLRPEVADELFGANQAELHRIGEALAKAQGKLDTEDLMRLGSSKSLTAKAVLDLVSAESKRAIAFNNKLIRAASKGLPDAEKIKPSEFVRYATRMDPADASRVMGILSDNPELVQNIRQLAVEDIWASVQAGAVGKERVSATLLKEALGNPVQQRTWRVILGNDTVDALETFIETTASREFAATAFKTAGAIGTGMETPRIFLKGELGAIPQIASRFLVAFLYSGPLKRSVTNLMTHNDRGRFLNGIVASTPFIEAVMERFGSDGGFLVMNSLREMVEPMQERALAIEGRTPTNFDPRTLSEEEFKVWVENNMRQ